ncbi:MAG: hypothetical protein ACI3ZY_13315 [Parabacteroides sp.]
MDIAGSRVTEIGEGVVIGRSLFAARSMLMRLPDFFVCKGTLDLFGCLVEELPQHLEVWGDLNISNTDIMSLPAKGLVKGGLIASSTHFRTLPSGFVFQLFGQFDDGKLEEVPEHLVLRNYISFKNCPVRSLGANANKLGAIWASGSALRSLPDNLIVRNGLDVSYCSMESLPKGLTVLGDLIARGSALKALKDDLVVDGILDITRTDVCIVPATVVYRNLRRSLACDVPAQWVGENPVLHVSGKYLFTGESIWAIMERKGDAFHCRSLNGAVTTWLMWKDDKWRYGKEFDGLER